MPRGFEDLVVEVGEFGRYQVRLVLITQVPFLVVTGSMLCTMFDSLQPTWTCSHLLNQTDMAGSKSAVDDCACSVNGTQLIGDFHSFIAQYDLACVHFYIPTLLTTSVMVGGVLGAIVFGHVADRYGRKRTFIWSCGGVVLADLGLATLGGSEAFIWLVLSLLFILGFFGGGYMVVSLVTLLESVGSGYRLLCVSCNGWPAGLMVMGLLGYLTGHWRWYHLSLGLLGVPLFCAAFLVDESARWLMQHRRFAEADVILRKIATMNGRAYYGLEQEPEAVTKTSGINHDESMPGAASEESGPFSGAEDSNAALFSGAEALSDRQYTYLDLVKYRRVLLYLLTLFYSWLSSSIISFGIYFGFGKLAGNIYLNTFLLGLLKGTTGMIPLALNVWMGRRPVILVSIFIACLSCWSMVLIYFIDSSKSIALLFVVLLGAAAIDPMWKINHLYSAELFPTVIRNMARAVCNVGSRVGSVVGPQINFLSTVFFPLPYIIYGCFAVVHFVLCIFALPETKNVPLPETLEDLSSQKESPRFSTLLISADENSQRDEFRHRNGYMPSIEA